MGRPKGSKNVSTLLQEAVITESTDVILKHFSAIVKKAVEKAEEGDLKAIKMIMDRVIPVRKAIEHRQGQGNAGVTIVVQGIAHVEDGKPVIEVKPETLDKLEETQDEG